MPTYNFKQIVKVPTATEFIDIILSKTQRKTPTVVRKGWKISRIRRFYMRKIKFTATNYHDRLSQILDGFPRLDDIHPFYADLINVLYSRDHYKLALGQINTARATIDNIGKDYLKLLKFAGSLYQAKELKRAALGRMCTCLKKLKASLAYLEQVRQHLARLPSINPTTRTLIITGYPNVGKSCFMNKISRANVDVQPYAFTTQSLFVGHCYHNYSPWQIIDTPGLLDHPLEAMNTIEMQAVTALAHLHSTVLYFVDISETCGYTIDQQVALYHNIKPLFANKPLLVVINKIDLKKVEDLTQEQLDLIQTIADDKGTQILEMSGREEIGIQAVKDAACKLLLKERLGQRMAGSRIKDIVNRIQTTHPVARDNVVRSSSIPESVRQAREEKKRGVSQPKRRTRKDIELEQGGPGIYSFNMQEYWKLNNPDHQFDIVPEIKDGKNIADFIDPEFEERLRELEEEEDRLAAQWELEHQDEDSGLDSDEQEMVDTIRERKAHAFATNLLKKSRNKPVMPRKYRTRTKAMLRKDLNAVGLDTDKIEDRTALQRKRKRVTDRVFDADFDDGDFGDGDDVMMEADGDAMMDASDMKKGDLAPSTRRRARSRSAREKTSRNDGMSGPERARSRARPRDGSVQRGVSGLPDEKARKRARKMMKIMQRPFQMESRGGTADRRVLDMRPKFFNSGKRGIGKTDWR